jgi:hypothetical protein
MGTLAHAALQQGQREDRQREIMASPPLQSLLPVPLVTRWDLVVLLRFLKT